MSNMYIHPWRYAGWNTMFISNMLCSVMMSHVYIQDGVQVHDDPCLHPWGSVDLCSTILTCMMYTGLWCPVWWWTTSNACWTTDLLDPATPISPFRLTNATISRLEITFLNNLSFPPYVTFGVNCREHYLSPKRRIARNRITHPWCVQTSELPFCFL